MPPLHALLRRVMVGSVVKHKQQPLAAIGGTYLPQQCDDPLGITRLAA